MKKEVMITNCRFQIGDNARILLQARTKGEELDPNNIVLYVGDRVADLTIEEKDNSLLAAEEENFGIRLYDLWTPTPEEWDASQEIRLYDKRNRAKKRLIFRMSGKKLQKKRVVMAYTENIRYQNGVTIIEGWYIGKCHKGSVRILNEQGAAMDCEVMLLPRKDVEFVYPEISTEDINGFRVLVRAARDETITLVLSTMGSKLKKTIKVKSISENSLSREIREKAERTLHYWRRYGARRTVLKMLGKVTHSEEMEYHLWRFRNQPSKEEIEKQKRKKFAWSPKISIVVPLYKTPENYLDALVQSIRSQTYRNWELCLSDGSGSPSPLKERLEKYCADDRRIRVVSSEVPLKISENTNRAIEMATGEFIAFADHDDSLERNALYECVKALNKNQDIEVIYTDEDKVSMNGEKYTNPHFKPDFNIYLLRSVNFFCHLCVVKKELLEKVGYLREEFDGAQDYDLMLRVVENTDKIHHVPKCLYHWRMHQDSTAANKDSKQYAFESGKRAIEDHYRRLGIKGKVTHTPVAGIYRTKYEIIGNPLVSILIPNKDHRDDLERCIRSIQEKSTYKNYECIIIENNSQEEQTFEYYKELEEKYPNVKVVFWEKEFNYSAINNFGETFAKGDYLLLLNNDTEMINGECIEELLSYCQQEKVGAVGARLYYMDDTIQHAGVVVGLGGIAGHSFVGLPRGEVGYFGRVICAQELSAVTAACMMVKREVFTEVGGFDEELKVAFNDIDLCMKIRSNGYKIIYDPYAELYHYESKSRGMEDTPEKVFRFNREIDTFRRKWKTEMDKGDPYYSPNFTLDAAYVLR